MLGFKKKIYVMLACALVLWPLVQHGLVRTYGVNPWRFFGWAMYAVPSPTLRIHHEFTNIEMGEEIKKKRSYKNAIKEFSQRRAHWGELEKPQHLADTLFTLVPEGRELRITVSSVYLDTPTAMLKERAQTYTFSR